MQVMDGQPAAGVWVRRSFHSVLAIESRKHNLADVGARRGQRARAQADGQVFPKPVHDAEYLFCRTLVVCNLHTQRSRVRDGVQKKTCGHISRDPQLPRLEHNVSLLAASAVLPLRRIAPQWDQPPLLISNPKQPLTHEISYPLFALVSSPETLGQQRIESQSQLNKEFEVTAHSNRLFPRCPTRLHQRAHENYSRLRT